MTFRELLEIVEWENVKESIMNLYPSYQHSIAGFESAFNELKKIDPPNGNTSLEIVIEKDDDGSRVFGHENDEEWAVEYTSWDKWLNFRVRESDLQMMSKADYVAHCLWELTWNGYTNQKVIEAISDLDNLD